MVVSFFLLGLPLKFCYLFSFDGTKSCQPCQPVSSRLRGLIGHSAMPRLRPEEPGLLSSEPTSLAGLLSEAIMCRRVSVVARRLVFPQELDPSHLTIFRRHMKDGHGVLDFGPRSLLRILSLPCTPIPGLSNMAIRKLLQRSDVFSKITPQLVPSIPMVFSADVVSGAQEQTKPTSMDNATKCCK